jgi:4-amino-4-deoxy-L-arabinose transferase-like glycosyltransferase
MSKPAIIAIAMMDTQSKPTPKAGATTGTRTKSVWRLVGGGLLIAGAANSLRNLPHEPMSHDLGYVIWRFVFTILLVAIGVWLVVSYVRRGRHR